MDQDVNAFGLYCIDKGVNIQDYKKQIIKAENSYSQNCKRLTNNLLGKYGDKRLGNLRNERVADIIDRAINFMTDEELDNVSNMYLGYLYNT